MEQNGRRTFLEEDPEHVLQDIVRILNKGFAIDRDDALHAEARANLAELVKAYKEACGSPVLIPIDPAVLKHHHAPLSIQPPMHAPKPTLLTMRFPAGCPDWYEINRRCKPLLQPAAKRVCVLVDYHGPEDRPWNSWDLACREFLRLIRTPEPERLGGPCPRKGCGNWFTKGTSREKHFCCRNCASIASGLEGTKRSREKAKEAISKYKPGRTRKPWKLWVAEYCAGEDISVKWLTRAVTKGELTAPAPR
jgi:hypothetical protein